MTDKELVKLCLREVSQKIGYRDDYKLSQSDLEHLSYLLEEKSKIVISLSTLKRVFQEKFGRLPQLSTLDALTIFLGYSGWQHFKASKSVNSVPESFNTPEPNESLIKKRHFFGSIQYALIILSIALMSFFLLRNSGDHDTANDSATFSVTKVVSDKVPKNVIFSYNIDDIEGDSFFIQPTWNARIKARIHKRNYIQTQTYYEPGFHTAKLICDGRVLKEVAVHIPTNDWIGYSKVNFFDPYPQYFNNDLIVRDSVLGITAAALQASDIDMEEKRIYYFAHFPDSLAVNSNDFTLKARIKTTTLGNTLCPWIVSEVLGERAFFYFTGTIPGCTSEIGAVFSDKYLDGKTNDLSAFGFNVLDWNEVKIEVRNKAITIHINGEKVFNDNFSSPGGGVQGIGFGSNGLCEVDYVELADSVGRIAYFNDFNRK